MAALGDVELVVYTERGADRRADVMMARVDAAGARIGEPLRVNEVAGTAHVTAEPSIEAIGGEVGVSWRTADDGLRFARFDATGARLGAEQAVPGMSICGASGMHWGSGSYVRPALTFTTPIQVQLAFMYQDAAPGTRLLPDVQPAGCQCVDAAWMGDGYAIVWVAREGGERVLRFARLSRSGSLIAGTSRVVAGAEGSLCPPRVSARGASGYRVTMVTGGSTLWVLDLDADGDAVRTSTATGSLQGQSAIFPLGGDRGLLATWGSGVDVHTIDASYVTPLHIPGSDPGAGHVALAPSSAGQSLVFDQEVAAGRREVFLARVHDGGTVLAAVQVSPD